MYVQKRMFSLFPFFLNSIKFIAILFRKISIVLRQHLNYCQNIKVIKIDQNHSILLMKTIGLMRHRAKHAQFWRQFWNQFGTRIRRGFLLASKSKRFPLVNSEGNIENCNKNDVALVSCYLETIQKEIGWEIRAGELDFCTGKLQVCKIRKYETEKMQVLC